METKQRLKEVLLSAGERLTPADLAAIALASRRHVNTVTRYFRKPEAPVGSIADAEFFLREAEKIISTKPTQTP